MKRAINISQTQRIKNIFFPISAAFVYGVLGTILVGLYLGIEDYFTRSQDIPGFSIHIEQSIGLLWVLLGLSLSAIAGNLIFGKTLKYFFLKWFSILTISAIAAVFLQMAFLIYASERTINEILSNISLEHFWYTYGIKWTIKLFLIFIPFTILFANIRLLLKKIKNRNSLK